MPTYEYKCLDCEREFEVKKSIKDDTIPTCPGCDGDTRQILHPPAVLYRGKGFFATDNKQDTRVRGESGALGRRMSETDASNIDDETPTRVDSRGRPKMTPTRTKASV